ncbi:MAG: VanZ family protein [Flavobacteriales bacterium]
MQKLTKLWLELKPNLFYVVFSIVTLGSLMPQTSVPPVLQTLSDKTLHILMYLAFSASLFWFLEKRTSQHQSLWLSISLSIAFGALMEVLQGQYIPGRFGSVLDLIANIIGVFTFVLLHQLNKKIFKN